MGATNARIVAVVQRIVRHIVFEHVAPDFLACPVGDGADFYQVKLRVPIDFADRGARGSLVATNCGNPGIERRQLSAQRLDFRKLQHWSGIAFPQRFAVCEVLVSWRQFGIEPLDFDSVSRFHSIDQVISFGEQKLGVAGEKLSR